MYIVGASLGEWLGAGDGEKLGNFVAGIIVGSSVGACEGRDGIGEGTCDGRRVEAVIARDEASTLTSKPRPLANAVEKEGLVTTSTSVAMRFSADVIEVSSRMSKLTLHV